MSMPMWVIPSTICSLYNVQTIYATLYKYLCYLYNVQPSKTPPKIMGLDCSPPEVPRTLRQYGTEGLKRAFNWAPIIPRGVSLSCCCWKKNWSEPTPTHLHSYPNYKSKGSILCTDTCRKIIILSIGKMHHMSSILTIKKSFKWLNSLSSQSCLTFICLQVFL